MLRGIILKNNSYIITELIFGNIKRNSLIFEGIFFERIFKIFVQDLDLKSEKWIVKEIDWLKLRKVLKVSLN